MPNEIEMQSRVWMALGDVETLHGLGSLSHRQALRALKRTLGEPIFSFENLRDEFQNMPRPELVPHFQAWLKSTRKRALFLTLLRDKGLMVLADRRGHLNWVRYEDGDDLIDLLARQLRPRDVLVPHGDACRLFRSLPTSPPFDFALSIFPEPVFAPPTNEFRALAEASGHLKQLEDEAIEIFRVAAAKATNPAMLFSMGKDSMVMLRLAEKAFAPQGVPFPILGIDTRWKFQAMYRFRDWLESREDLDYRVFVNPDAIELDTNPFRDGSAFHTDVTKTQALRMLLDEGKFDFVFGGARRDEEKSRAKERVFSLRDSNQRWDPRNQRPELWNSYNTTLVDGQTMRVFPLSNWTEKDIWEYIQAEHIPLVPLYFSALRPVVRKGESLLMVDDDRFPIEPDAKVLWKHVRFRTLGCYPLTGATLSFASTIDGIRSELSESNTSERSTRVIDRDSGASMEQKKREGYF